MKGDRVRIVMLTAFFHPHIGGVERHVRYLSEELVRQGHSITVLTKRYDRALPSEERLGPIRILRFPQSTIPHTQKPGVWLWLLSRLHLLLRADVIHVHDHTAFNAWYLPFRILLPWKPVFATFHGYEGLVPIPRRYIIGRKWVERLTRGNICVGHFLEKWYGTQSDVVIYGAVDPPEEIREPEPRTIVFMGRLEPDTGIMDYLRAMPLIVKGPAGPDEPERPLKLIVCGDGSLRREVRAFAESRALDVEMIGAVQDPSRWIQRGRFIFASGYLTILEAMTCRRLVFSVHDNPLKRDYLEMMPGAADMMVVAGSPEELAGRVREILDRPDRESAMVERACRFAREHTWERMAGTYLDLYLSRGVRVG